MATALYERIIGYDYGDQERNDLMRKVWQGTPYVVNVTTGSINSDEWQEIMQFCRDEFGTEAWPIHGRAGRWQSGSATVFGETFIGFDTSKAMATFIRRFPDRVLVSEVPAP